MRLRLCALVFLGSSLVAGGELPLSRFDRVEAAPVKSSLYVGSVTLSAGTFVRRGSAYESEYAAKVFPYFFYSEKGRLVVTVPDPALRRLAHGQPIDFTGQGIRADGVVRLVDGRATPTGETTGRLKVRIHLNRRITLVFDTTYRLPSVMASGTR